MGEIVAQMNVDVFQYKLLVIPSTQDKSQMEVGKQVMNHSLVRKQDQATYKHALSNTCWTRK